jgi:5-methylcytosine-specific restriction endonuclease McrA
LRLIRDAADHRIHRTNGGDTALQEYVRTVDTQESNDEDSITADHRILCTNCFKMVQKELDFIQMSVKINKYKQSVEEKKKLLQNT